MKNKAHIIQSLLRILSILIRILLLLLIYKNYGTGAVLLTIVFTVLFYSDAIIQESSTYWEYHKEFKQYKKGIKKKN